MNEDTVTISKKEYLSLLDDQLWLEWLNNCGVDNWCGYDEARAEYRKEKLKEVENERSI